MIIELVGLEVDLTNVNINISYGTHIQLRNKPQIPDVTEDNNLPFTHASNDTHTDETASALNLHSPHKDSSELVTFSGAYKTTS